MRSLKLKKIVVAALTIATISTLSSVGASAAWRYDSNGWWNTEGNSYSIGWRNINDTWYYFGSDGYMRTGWVLYGGKWYYLDSSGAMRKGWISYKNNWYFTDSSGVMQTGVLKIEDKVYYFNQNGVMQTGNLNINGKVYKFSIYGDAVGDIPTPSKIFNKSGVEQKQTDDNNTTTNPSTNPTDSDSTDNNSTSSGGSSHDSSHNSSNPLSPISGYNKITKVNANEYKTTANSDKTFKFRVNNLKWYETLYITNENGDDVNITGNNTTGYKIDINYESNKTIIIKEVSHTLNSSGLSYKVDKQYTLTIN